MPVEQQESRLWYAWCVCGVCGKPRRRRELAQEDADGHDELCIVAGDGQEDELDG